MTEHTPGPWHVSPLPTTAILGREIIDAGGGLAAETVPENARLIAAAPDLLAACKGMVAAYRRDRFAKLDDEREAFVACLDAIDKATESA